MAYDGVGMPVCRPQPCTFQAMLCVMWTDSENHTVKAESCMHALTIDTT